MPALKPAELAQGTAHVLTAAVAGPALLVAGWQYPGTWRARGFLMCVGAAVIATHYHYFQQDVKRLQG